MLKILPLGGMGNVTKNMFAYDTGEAILLVDCGIGFPDENMPGVDLLIPDTTWLENKKDRIVGMILTHGHDDHTETFNWHLVDKTTREITREFNI